MFEDEVPQKDEIKVGNEFDYELLNAYKIENKVELMIIDGKANQVPHGRFQILEIYKSVICGEIYYNEIILIKQV